MKTEDIVLFLEQIGVKRIKLATSNIHGTCPFGEDHANGEDRSPSWGISVDLPHLYGCFACGAKGSIVDLLIKKGGFSKEKALAISGVAPQAATDVHLPKLTCQRLKRSEVQEAIPEERLYPFKRTKEVYSYMNGRGISREACKGSRLLYDPSQNRILFPWRIGKSLVGVTGRAVDENSEAKMLPYFNMRKSRYVFVPTGRVDNTKPLILCEGEIDAIKIWQAGFNSAALGFGTFTDEQQNLVLNLRCPSIYVFTDNDKAGDKLKKQIKEKLSKVTILGVVPYVERTQRGDDPARLTTALIRECVSHVKFFT